VWERESVCVFACPGKGSERERENERVGVYVC